MRYLYLLLLISFGVLLWAVFSIARHIRKHAGQDAVVANDPGKELPDVMKDAEVVAPAVTAGQKLSQTDSKNGSQQ
jgi:hypothetical protein